jgi:hypothetical protein
MRYVTNWVASICFVVALWHATTWAEDFRVESTVFAEKDKQPISHSTTLFHVGVVYDYLSEPKQVAVLDQARGRFILLDIDRRQKTEIKLDEVAAFAGQTRAQATKSLNGFLKFSADPKFNIQNDEKSEELVFGASSLSYRVKPVAASSAESAEQYREFSDWYARLNSFTNPGALPPFPRITVNEELARRRQLPETVSLEIPKQLALGGRGLSLRSEHIITWRLLQRDLDTIAATGAQMSSFKTVSFSDYRKTLAK